MKKKALNLKKIYREELAVISNPFQRKRLHDDILQDISRRIESDAQIDMIYLGLDLHWLSVWEAHNGLVSLLDSDERGWERVEMSARLEYWHIRVMVYLYKDDPNPAKAARVSRNTAALCLAHMLATEGSEEQARWLGTELVESFDNGAIDQWPGTPFEPFMARLFALWANKAVPDSLQKCKLGVYGRLMENLRGSPDAIADALIGACDYHVANSTSTPGYPEFAVPLYEVYPAEILAADRVRRQGGLLMPAIEHPLMSTPLAKPPAAMPRANNPVLDAVLAKIRTIWPTV
jgi:hypothetical protein